MYSLIERLKLESELKSTLSIGKLLNMNIGCPLFMRFFDV